jgi:hypothetical protein
MYVSMDADNLGLIGSISLVKASASEVIRPYETIHLKGGLRPSDE